ncbi:MAG: hypothetical protein E7616_04070 [Ruminococcaceae bacterium]|nr:hypothetical protein [Oscillospiraceae bacterium]
MTPIEIEKALAEIVLEKERIVDEKLRVLDKGAKTEKKALMIEKGMYSLCLHAGLLYNAMGETERAKCIEIKSRRMPYFMRMFPEIKKAYESADCEEKLHMTAALYGEIWMKEQFVLMYRSQLSRAEAAGETALIFELGLKLDAVESVLAAWKEWRRENNVYPELAKGEK